MSSPFSDSCWMSSQFSDIAATLKCRFLMSLFHSCSDQHIFPRFCPFGAPFATLSLPDPLQIHLLHSPGTAQWVICLQAVASFFWNPPLFLGSFLWLLAAPYSQKSILILVLKCPHNFHVHLLAKNLVSN
jgi:hypothetical protein